MSTLLISRYTDTFETMKYAGNPLPYDLDKNLQFWDNITYI